VPEVTLEVVNPNRPDVIQLIQELDDHLVSLYPVENRHLLDITSLMKPNIKFLLASINGEAVGCGAVRFFDDYAEIKRMYVRPGHRGTGVGYRLLSRLEELAKAQGYTILRLETGVYQQDAIRLYERYGFARCDAFGEYINGPLNMCYEKQLVPK
jgi:putative acetyltransferase